VFKIKDGEINGACSSIRAMRNGYKNLAGKPEGKRSLWRPIYWNNIKMDLKHGLMMWAGLIWGSPVAGSCENGTAASGSTKGGEFLGEFSVT
jgi:hypothetical protein